MLSGDLLGVRVVDHFFKAPTTILRPTLVFFPDVIDLDGCLPADTASTILPAKCLESCGSLPSFAATSASHKLFLLTRAVLSSKSFKRPPYLHARSSKVKDKSAFRTDTLLALTIFSYSCFDKVLLARPAMAKENLFALSTELPIHMFQQLPQIFDQKPDQPHAHPDKKPWGQVWPNILHTLLNRRDLWVASWAGDMAQVKKSPHFFTKKHLKWS